MAEAANQSGQNRLLRTGVLLAGGIVVVTSTSACASRAADVGASAQTAPAQRPTVQNLARRPVSDIPEIKKVVDSAIEQTQHTFEYDPS